MARVQAGHGIILKRGMSETVAVGEVVCQDGQCSGKGNREWLTDLMECATEASAQTCAAGLLQLIAKLKATR